MKVTLASKYPDLAAQLVEPGLGDLLTYGSAKKVEWRCELGHIWAASPNTRTTMGSGCPVCAGKTVLVGFNDLGSQNPQLAAQLADPSLASALTPRSGRKVEWLCPKGHTWAASVNTRAAGHGCAVCTSKKVVPGVNDLATTHPTIAAQLADPAQATTVTAFSARKLLWMCGQGHNWLAPVSRLTNGTTCPYCSGLKAITGQTDMATTHPELAAQLVDTSLGAQLKAQSNKKVDWICGKGHTWSASPNARVNGGTGCPVCANRTVVQGFNDLATTHPQLARQLNDTTLGTTITYGHRTPVTWLCEHGHLWDAQPNGCTSSRSGCPACAAACFVSRGETELAVVIARLVPEMNVSTTVRNILPRSELDIVVSEAKLAFEFNGLWWHSEAHLDTNYHQTKSRFAAEAGYRLVHVWEDDWAERQEIVIRGIAHRLGVTHRLLEVLPEAHPKIANKVFARVLTLGTATSSEARAFWLANHLQGPVGSSRYFALRDNDGDIRALLGVGAKNHGSRAKAVTGVWDVQRYATLGHVPGGFTRLLKFATQQLRAEGREIHTWTSYSDNDVSDGGMYRAAGFVIDKIQRPSYSYVGALTGWKRAHRTNFTRGRFIIDDDLLYEDGWTEHQAALANGLYRVYDAGKTRWIKNV